MKRRDPITLPEDGEKESSPTLTLSEVVPGELSLYDDDEVEAALRSDAFEFDVPSRGRKPRSSDDAISLASGSTRSPLRLCGLADTLSKTKTGKKS